MTETKTASSAEDQARLMRTDLTNGIDDILASLHSVTRAGGRVVVTGGSLLEREINMAIRLSEDVRDSLFSAEALEEARARPLNHRLRSDGYRLVDLLADVGGVTVHGAIRVADTFFAQRPPITEGAQAVHEGEEPASEGEEQDEPVQAGSTGS
jgi:hypothetical protein